MTENAACLSFLYLGRELASLSVRPISLDRLSQTRSLKLSGVRLLIGLLAVAASDTIGVAWRELRRLHKQCHKPRNGAGLKAGCTQAIQNPMPKQQIFVATTLRGDIEQAEFDSDLAREKCSAALGKDIPPSLWDEIVEATYSYQVFAQKFQRVPVADFLRLRKKT